MGSDRGARPLPKLMARLHAPAQLPQRPSVLARHHHSFHDRTVLAGAAVQLAARPWVRGRAAVQRAALLSWSSGTDVARRARRARRLQRCSDAVASVLIHAHSALHGGSAAGRAEVA